MKLPAYSEGPEMAALVKEGKLPPVEQRLPNEPVVIDPMDEMGVYGGELKAAATSPRTAGVDTMFSTIQNILTLTPDRTSVAPNVAKGYNLSNSNKTMTLFLHEGLKWSDGQPYTADDYVFYYEGFMLNKDLMPKVPKRWAPGGQNMKVTKVDDCTVLSASISRIP